jgi:1-phosphofructokinase/tagatose 6-phosphate kinase
VASLLGEDDQRHTYEVTAPEVDPIATVGSGDAFLAGYVAARYDGRPPDECLRFAVACGAESTHHFGAGSIDPAEVGRLLPGVEGRELEAPAKV